MKRLWLILPLLFVFSCEDKPKPKDCFGVADGEAIIDDCGECTGGTTGLDTNYLKDCAGDCNGTAFENLCEFCVGGNTELDTIYCGTVTDIESNIYNAVIIGNQVWMAENLKVTKYRDGTAIPTGHTNSDWANLSTGAYAIYNNNASNEVDTYGNLYNWYAVDDSRNIAPEGWHVPTVAEWTTLISYLGGGQVAGGKLKETGTTHWNSPNEGATNESGFTALPGGYRNYENGNYSFMGKLGYFWSTTDHVSGRAWSRPLHYMGSHISSNSETKGHGFSIRCVRE